MRRLVIKWGQTQDRGDSCDTMFFVDKRRHEAWDSLQDRSGGQRMTDGARLRVTEQDKDCSEFSM